MSDLIDHKTQLGRTDEWAWLPKKRTYTKFIETLYLATVVCHLNKRNKQQLYWEPKGGGDKYILVLTCFVIKNVSKFSKRHRVEHRRWKCGGGGHEVGRCLLCSVTTITDSISTTEMSQMYVISHHGKLRTNSKLPAAPSPFLLTHYFCFGSYVKSAHTDGSA